MVLRLSEIQTISIAVASAGVFAAAIYYIFQIRHQTKLRQTDVIMRLHSFYNSETFQRAVTIVFATDYKDYDDFVKKNDSSSVSDVVISSRMVGGFFEGVGVLLSEKLIDINLVRKLFAVEPFWEKAEPIVKGMRKHLGRPALHEWFEYLYNEVKREKGQSFIQSSLMLLFGEPGEEDHRRKNENPACKIHVPAC